MRQKFLETIIADCGDMDFTIKQKKYQVGLIKKIHVEYQKEFNRGVAFEIRHREMLRDYDIVR